MKSFTGLKVAKYHEMRNLHPELPSHYVYTACQDAAAVWSIYLRPAVRRWEPYSAWLDGRP